MLFALGIQKDDYTIDEFSQDDLTRAGGYLDTVHPDVGADEHFGQVTWTKLRSSDVDNVPTFCGEDEKASPKRQRDCECLIRHVQSIICSPLQSASASPPQMLDRTMWNRVSTFLESSSPVSKSPTFCPPPI